MRRGTTLAASLALLAVATPCSALEAESLSGGHPESLGLRPFAEMDAGLAAVSGGGIGTFLGVGEGPWRGSVGFYRFDAPSAVFSGVPEGFGLRVNYLLSLNADYFLNGRMDDGLYLRMMVQTKEHLVTNLASQTSRYLPSKLAGLEVGYVWRLYQGLYVAPRIGALYYFQSPQGVTNAPVVIDDRSYDNERHKTWDTYFVPTVSVGYTF